MKKQIRLLILLCLFLVSCKTDINLEQIIDNNRIIFLGDDHIIANPKLFLANNLEEFSKRGVKHICFEGFSLRIPQNEDYDFYCYFPWERIGNKYEDVILSQKINELNDKLSVSEKIQIYNPEAIIPDSNLENLEYYDRLNFRDSIVFDFIENLYQTIPKNEKILIFYGYKHGIKRKEKWETLCYRLKQKHEDCVSLNFDYSLKNTDNTIIKRQVNFAKYDYLIKQAKDETYGICYQYYFSKENIMVMLQHLLCFSQNTNVLFTGECNYLSNEREFLNDIYYLKMLMGDRFYYSLWKETCVLEKALQELQSYIQENNIVYQNNIEMLQNYNKYMSNSGIQDFILYDKNLNLRYTKKMLLNAYSCYSEDVWCLYWLASVELELKEYKEAIIDFERCLEYKTINNIEILPRIYEKLIFLSEITHDDNKKDKYQTRYEELSKETILKVTKMTDIR